MANIPEQILRQLYTLGSLVKSAEGYQFSLKNRLSDALIQKVNYVEINGKAIDLSRIVLYAEGAEQSYPAESVSPEQALNFPLRAVIKVVIQNLTLSQAQHRIALSVSSEPFGEIAFTVEDEAQNELAENWGIPRQGKDDYSKKIISARHRYIEQFTGKTLEHLNQYSFSPERVRGNCEHFVGAAQVPVGIAGPLKVNGEQAQGEFLIPLATTEGTLVASYNRGIQVLNLSGGVKTTILADKMQRAPVFVLEDARAARHFADWLGQYRTKITEIAEATSSIAKLQDLDIYLSHKFCFVRFDFSTGDAAGQNMVSKATQAACQWIIEHYQDYQILHFYLESNLATDKKSSYINTMRTRGKRVNAECVIKREVLQRRLRVSPEQLTYHAQIANIGAMLSGANNNGLHSANGITAMFIATGQDVANVAESSAATIYSEITPTGDLYAAITLPSLIVATYGGGTGLATQREALEMMDCYGNGKIGKLAEIIAGVVLAGEISLAAAISSADWVSSHEKYGRNR